MLQGRIERDLAALGASATRLDYRLYLCRMHGFLAPIEQALAETAGLSDVVEDAARRNAKAALLARDLAALGVDRGHLAEVPRLSVPRLDELPEALGWMYVIESATLEAESLARQLAPRLPAELACSSAFLRCYGDRTPARWRAFAAAVDAYVARADVGVCDRMVLAATDCLIRLHRWLSAPAAPPIQVHARRIHA
jgi:heme oxygenase